VAVPPALADDGPATASENELARVMAALENIGWIGVTFGGKYFWGHGIALNGGSANFILIDFQVN